MEHYLAFHLVLPENLVHVHRLFHLNITILILYLNHYQQEDLVMISHQIFQENLVFPRFAYLMMNKIIIS